MHCLTAGSLTRQIVYLDEMLRLIQSPAHRKHIGRGECAHSTDQNVSDRKLALWLHVQARP